MFHFSLFFQMFKYCVTDETFDSYLEQNVPNVEQRTVLAERAYEVNEYGYTGAG